MMRVLRRWTGVRSLAGGFAAGVTLAAPAIAQSRKRVRLGYLHVVAVDGQIFTGLDRGSFDKQGIDFELVERNTGPEVFEAMARGEVDVLSAGGVISNYLALGAGRAFLINDIEVATAQLWVRPDRGVRTFADLRGKRIATTTRTTAHIFLDRALRANGLGLADVQVLNSSMPQAVGCVHCRGGAGRCALGAFQPQRSRQTAGRHQAGGCLRLLSAVGRGRRLGHAA